MGFVIYRMIIIPNFRPDDYSPPPGMVWYDGNPNSVLLGGIILSLLVIPFLAPLFDDAIRNVPNFLKEASLGLGATRWHTLMNVTLPVAASSLVSAAGLGALKAMGDVIIVAFLIGYETNIPTPFFDILRAQAPLTATGAGLSGGLLQSFKNPLGEAVANFAGLLLMTMAFIILASVSILQKRFRKRFAYDGR
jgi:phosphate transport system permease protein